MYSGQVPKVGKTEPSIQTTRSSALIIAVSMMVRAAIGSDARVQVANIMRVTKKIGEAASTEIFGPEKIKT